MPRYNQSTIQQGQVADPTAGLANLAQEAKSQDELNKQQRQRYAAVRQAIAVKGLMGKVGVKSTSGGNIEITGAEGGMSDSDAKKAYYGIRQEDEGIKGVGKTSSTTVDDSLMKQGLARQAEAVAADQAQSAPVQAAQAAMIQGKIPDISGTKSSPIDLDKIIGAIWGRADKAQQTADAAEAASAASISQATSLSPQMMQQKNMLGTVLPSTPVKPPMAPTDSNPAVTAPDPNVTGTEKLPEIPKLDPAKDNPDGATTGAILSHGPYKSELGAAVSVNAANGVAAQAAPTTAAGTSSSTSKSISAGGSESKGSTIAVGYKGVHAAEGGNVGVATTVENNDGGTIVDNVQMSRRDLMAAQLDADSQSNAWGGQKTSVFDNAIAQKNAINQAVNQALQSRFSGTKQEYVGSYNTAYSGASYDGSASKNMAQQSNVSVHSGDRISGGGGAASPIKSYIFDTPGGHQQDIKVNEETGMIEATENNTANVLINNEGLHREITKGGGRLGSAPVQSYFDAKIESNQEMVRGWRTEIKQASKPEEDKIYFYAPGDKPGNPIGWAYRNKSGEERNELGQIVSTVGGDGTNTKGEYGVKWRRPVSLAISNLFTGTTGRASTIGERATK